MTFQQFEELAQKAWTEIPPEYKQGIAGLVIEKDSHSHPEHDDFFTLGECVTEAYPSEFSGPETVRSSVVLYYGSFRAVALDDDQFDWEYEITETLLHELQHHLEHLADDDALADFDYAVEENYKRVEGEPFDPLFFRAGANIEGGRFRVEDDVFVELESAGMPEQQYQFEWLGARYRVPLPATEADIHYAIIDQEMPDVRGDMCIVRVRKHGLMGTLRAAFGSRGYSVEEMFVPVEAI